MKKILSILLCLLLALSTLTACGANTEPPAADVKAVAEAPATETETEAPTADAAPADEPANEEASGESSGEGGSSLEMLEEAALAGNAEAAQLMGEMNQSDENPNPNYEEALKWDQIAVELGQPRAMTNLGILYLNGWGTEQDYAEALKWFEQGVEAGDEKAPRYVGIIYENGYGVDVNLEKAAASYEEGSERGDITSKQRLASMYEEGRGVEQDYEKAYELYLESSERDDHIGAPSQYAIGRMYENGWGVEQDIDTAIEWYERAAANTSEEAAARLAELRPEGASGEASSMEDFLAAMLPNIDGPYEVEETNVEFESHGLTLRGVLTVPVTEGDKKLPMVVLTHGFNSVSMEMYPAAQALGKNGIASIRYDLAANGDSDGDYLDVTFTSQKEDVLAALDYARSLDFVDTDNLFLMGNSQGGFDSAMAAVDCEDEINALILWFPAICIPDDFRDGHVQFVEFDPNNIPEKLDFMGLFEISRAFIEEGMSIDPMNDFTVFQKDVLILHGTDDEIVPYDYAVELAEAYPNAEFITIEGGGHGFFGEQMAAALNATIAFIQEHLTTTANESASGEASGEASVDLAALFASFAVDEELQEMIDEYAPKFQEQEYTDSETGLSVTYSLFLPENYDEETAYPMIVFIPDSSAVGRGDAALTQGWGGLIWATDEEQAKHPCIVMVPQYPEVILDDHDGFVTTDYVDLTPRMILAVAEEYGADTNRIYATGQSMGCMTFMLTAARYPDLFAAELFVDGQWDITELSNLATQTFFYITAGGDDKASGGQDEVMAMLDEMDVPYSYEYGWDAQADPAELNALAAAELADGNKINMARWETGTVINGDDFFSFIGSEHMASFNYAYKLETVRDWLFEQTKGDDGVALNILPSSEMVIASPNTHFWYRIDGDIAAEFLSGNNDLAKIFFASADGASSEMAEFEHKAKGEPDSAYTPGTPIEIGDYRVRAVVGGEASANTYGYRVEAPQVMLLNDAYTALYPEEYARVSDYTDNIEIAHERTETTEDAVVYTVRVIGALKPIDPASVGYSDGGTEYFLPWMVKGVQVEDTPIIGAEIAVNGEKITSEGMDGFTTQELFKLGDMVIADPFLSGVLPMSEDAALTVTIQYDNAPDIVYVFDLSGLTLA